ncbi:MAG: hypothetical protein SNJ72_07130, partial [Fimbriimonadales bacterium]
MMTRAKRWAWSTLWAILLTLAPIGGVWLAFCACSGKLQVSCCRATQTLSCCASQSAGGCCDTAGVACDTHCPGCHQFNESTHPVLV